MANRIIGSGPHATKPQALPVHAPGGTGGAQVQHLHVDDGSAGQRLDNFLLRVLKGVPKTHVYRVIRSGEVRINMKRAQAQTKLSLGDSVRVPPVRVAERATDQAGDALTAQAPPREFTVLFEDEQLLAIDKPAGVAVHGGSGVSFGVIEQLRRARPPAAYLELVHRLDKETSGVMLIAKSRRALLNMQAQFRERGTDKVYAALVNGHWPERKKVIDVALRKSLDARGERVVHAVPADTEAAKRSITLVRVAQALASHTLLDVNIKTGRTHQIRVHLAHEGATIVGDPKYGDFEANRALARGPLRFSRMFLHACRLAFDHPATGQRLELLAPMPPECLQLLERLGAA